MLPRFAVTLVALLVGPWAALAEPAAVPPDLDCKLGFDALRNWSAWLPGAKQKTANPNVVTLEDPDVWRVEITFTEPGQPAHPAIVLRKFVKQVTGVWTAQSKECGYGNQAEYIALVDAMKAEDSRLTNASRDEVERLKREQSPLGQ
ncbi:MAG: hypothetical protein QM780_03260 [Hyphomicrobium sp.]|uniref:hypothetical protein n=1 Tax=Hyphomicrobium sp. TaxID=82 RepID=UPI0039E6C9AD